MGSENPQFRKVHKRFSDNSFPSLQTNQWQFVAFETWNLFVPLYSVIFLLLYVSKRA